MERYSGVLMHISSLGGKYGIGTLGKKAKEFCDFLKETKTHAWQVLPINPHGPGFSPYNSISSFAGNPLFIDPERLAELGLLTEEECVSSQTENTGRVDFKTVITEHTRLLRLAFSRFKDFSALEAFCEREKNWISDYATFMTIREEIGGVAWPHFPKELRNRSALPLWREEHKRDEDYYKFEQFMFFSQWEELRSYAKECGISLIGDVPIYVSYDSCDVWASPEIFNLSENLVPLDVSGCPPDAFSSEGQLWGNPTYNWDKLSKEGYSWWIERLSHCAKMFDVVRLDHFRGFEAYWSVPYGSDTARTGEWKKGPDKPFFDAVKEALPSLDIIAEDLGFLTEEVFRLRDGCGFPGMRVLQFAFDSDDSNIYLPDKYIENCVVYTGTHDNDTLRGFIESAPEYKLSFASGYLSPKEDESLADAFLNAAWSSKANIAIAPMQDLLNLPASARMNIPSTVNDKNWRWRILDDFAADGKVSEKLLKLNQTGMRI